MLAAAAALVISLRMKPSPSRSARPAPAGADPQCQQRAGSLHRQEKPPGNGQLTAARRRRPSAQREDTGNLRARPATTGHCRRQLRNAERSRPRASADKLSASSSPSTQMVCRSSAIPDDVGSLVRPISAAVGWADESEAVMASLLEDLDCAAVWISRALQSSGYAADFSPASLCSIDRFLDEHTTGGKPRPGGLLAPDFGARLFALGAHTGKVIRRNLGGTWRAEDEDPEGKSTSSWNCPVEG